MRAPLVAGYLWLLFIWLVADPASPDPGSSELYDRLGQVAGAAGPVGQAIAASVAAYLVGSLISTVIVWLVRTLNDNWSTASLRHLGFSLTGRRASAVFGQIDATMGEAVDIGDIVFFAGIGEGWGTLRRSNFALVQAIEEIADHELGSERRRLESAVKWAESQVDGQVGVVLIRRGSALMARFDVPEVPEGGTESFTPSRDHVIPQFSPAQDLFRQFPVLQTRLIEHAETTGLKVERLHAEAELRIAVALPLFVLVLLFSTESALWLGALFAPLALAVQGVVLMRQGNRELLDALRSRSGTDELTQITSVFSRYRTEAATLSDAIRKGRWEFTPNVRTWRS